MADAETWSCPQCGAPARAGAVACDYCKAELRKVACPSCFGLMFLGARYCSRCGARAASVLPQRQSARCPRCQATMAEHALGGCVLDQCGSCGGVWLDADEFSRIREDRDAQAAFVGPGAPAAVPTADPTVQPLVYLPCPRCGDLMNRVNFAGTSGIVLDSCRNHGTWFDKDELPAVIEFIRAGGLDDARRQALEQLRQERARLEQTDRPIAAGLLSARPFGAENDSPLGLKLAGRLLRALLG